MGIPLRAASAAIVVAALVVLPGLGRAPFDDPGEGMHAEIARELLVSGDPFALTLSGVPYVDKPPLLYLLIAGTLAAAGPSEWAARLPSAMAALVAVGATAALGAHLLGRPGPAVLAGVALATSLGFFAYARYVRPETLLLATLACGFLLTLVGLRQARRPLVAAGLLAFGAAGLAKDPLAALGPPLAIVLAQALAGRARPLRVWLPVSGIVGGLLLAVGWWILAEARTPGFTWYTVVDNHLLNVARARHFPDEDVSLGAGAFLAVAAAGAAPWVLAAGVAVLDMVRRRSWRDPEESAWVALGLWALGVLVLTTLSPFRLPHYGLPAYPAIAVLAARGWATAKGRALGVAHAALFVSLAVLALAGWASQGDLVGTHVMTAADVATRKAGEAAHESMRVVWGELRPGLGGAALVLGGGAGILALLSWRGAPPMRLAAVVAVTMLTLMPVVGVSLAVVATHRAVRPLAAELKQRIGAADTLVHEGPLENSGALEWYAGRRPVIVDGERSVLGFGATLAHGRERFWDAERLLAVWQGRERVWLVTARPPEASVVPRLAGAELVVATGGRRLYVNRRE